ncbi:MAG TPA: hypothetical protein VF596_04405, partial [Pyrinomonadaceae bacterium]
HYREKKFLVLEKDQYDYAKALSDISGVDIKSHNNQPVKIVRVVRNWLTNFIDEKIHPAAKVWENFNYFMEFFFEEGTKQGFSEDDIYEMPTGEYIRNIKDWLKPKSA